MTTYIGRIGDMIPVGCASSAPISREQRAVIGGGAGTLSPRRVRVYGPGAREWSVQVGVREFADSNPLASIARTQARYGGSLRVIPCEAVDHNMLTPQASESLDGWTNVARGWRASFPDLDLTSSVIPLTIPFVIGGAGGALTSLSPRPSSLGKIIAAQTAVAPHVPAVKRGTVRAYVYASGSGTLRLRIWDEAETSTTVTQSFTGTAGVLVRVGVSATLAASAVSMQLEVVAGGSDIHIAWPSLAHKDNPYTEGRGVDQAYVTEPSRDIYGTWNKGLETVTYQIIEVGV